jgi:hypothetical protein
LMPNASTMRARACAAVRRRSSKKGGSRRRAGRRASIESAESQVFGDGRPRSTGVFQRLLGKIAHGGDLRLGPGGRVGSCVNLDAAGQGRALAAKHLHKLPLAIARDAGDADDLAPMDGGGGKEFWEDDAHSRSTTNSTAR